MSQDDAMALFQSFANATPTELVVEPSKEEKVEAILANNPVQQHEVQITANLKENSLIINAANDEPVGPAKLTLSDLFKQWLQDEQLKIASLDLDKEEDYNKLTARLCQLEDVYMEAKTRFLEGEKALRKHNAARGKTRWDKERRGENILNGSLATLSDPEHVDQAKKDANKLKKKLGQLEQAIIGFLQLGMDDADIIDTMVASGKGKRTVGQVTEALRTAKKEYQNGE